MPSPIEEVIKRRVIEQWLSGEARDKIASNLQIGAGTVSSIVSDFKTNLQNSDIDSIRDLAREAKKQGFTLSAMAAHIRLYNFFIESGASEEKVESFITNVSSNDIPPEKAVEYVNQLFAVSREELIPPNQISSYIQQKIQEKQKIEEEIKQANDTSSNLVSPLLPQPFMYSIISEIIIKSGG